MPDEPGYSLILCDRVTYGEAEIANITKRAARWSRSIRLQGGYWMGTFYFQDYPDVMADFYHTQVFSRIVERVGSEITWEGYIDEMVYDGRQIQTTVLGYIHTANDRRVTAAGSGTANISARLTSIIGSDCEFLSAGAITENTTQVPQTQNIKTYAWDELLRLTEIGDGTNPFRIYVGPGRKVYYEEIANTPRYYARGGMIRRRARSDIANYVDGDYTDTGDTVQTLTAASNLESIDQYGRREAGIVVDNVDQATAEALRDTQLKENSWPWARPISGRPGVALYSAAGDRIPLDPRLAHPGVVRDLDYFAGEIEEYGGWLPDKRDGLVEEVEVGTDGQLYLRSLGFSETEMMEIVERARQEDERVRERERD